MLRRYLNKKDKDLLLECEEKQHPFIIVSYCKNILEKEGNKGVFKQRLRTCNFLCLEIAYPPPIPFSSICIFNFKKLHFRDIALLVRKIYVANLR